MSGSLSFLSSVAANTELHRSKFVCVNQYRALPCPCETWIQGLGLLVKGHKEQAKKSESTPATDLLVSLGEVLNTSGAEVFGIWNVFIFGECGICVM